MATKNNKYACTSCKKTFGRKYNAERHNKIVHDEMAMVYDKETDWKSSINKKIIPSNTIARTTKSIESSSIYTPSKIESIEDIKDPLSSQVYNNNLKDLYKSNLDLNINENEDDQIVFNTIGKISPYIDTLDSLLLSRSMDNKDRNKILSSILISSLSTSNPASFIKEQINYYRSLIAMKRAISLISYHFNTDLKQARETLKGLVLTAPYFKNKFNNKKNR